MELILQNIQALIREKREASTAYPFMVAIDGRCASGKTTMAGALSEILHAPVVHMDDFFLRPQQRTPDRLAAPGENIDHERFQEEVILPLVQGSVCTYAPFSCSTGDFLSPVTLMHDGLVIVEGTYALHKNLYPYYDLRFFLTVDPEEQMKRIRRRNGEAMARIFESKWIPMEEAYFKEFSVTEKVHAVFSLK